jgi:hypothetical protein
MYLKKTFFPIKAEHAEKSECFFCGTPFSAEKALEGEDLNVDLADQSCSVLIKFRI